MLTRYRPRGAARRWQFDSRRIYVRPRTAKLQATSVPIAYGNCAPRAAAPWDRQTDRQVDRSSYRIKPPPYGGGISNK